MNINVERKFLCLQYMVFAQVSWCGKSMNINVAQKFPRLQHMVSIYCNFQGNLKGESCRQIWRQVIVPPDFFVTKPIKQFCYAYVAFFMWT